MSSSNTTPVIMIAVILAALFLSETLGDYAEYKLYEKLLANYNKMERPIANFSAPLLVTLGVALQQIADVVCCW